MIACNWWRNIEIEFRRLQKGSEVRHRVKDQHRNNCTRLMEAEQGAYTSVFIIGRPRISPTGYGPRFRASSTAVSADIRHTPGARVTTPAERRRHA